MTTARPTSGNNRRGDDTRQRLLEAANRRFRRYGYEATTAASIAAEAGTTERTFFRHFPTKADVLLANWEHLGDALRHTLDTSTAPDASTVVREALAGFVAGISAELDAGLDSVVRLYTDRSAFVGIMKHLLGVERDLAAAIAERSDRTVDDFEVRVAANASMGVFRASVRAVVIGTTESDMVTLVDRGMGELRQVFDALESSRS